MFILDGNATVRIINSETGETDKIIQGELDVFNDEKSITVNISNSIELENGNLNAYEVQKKSTLNTLQSLLDENKHYYVNRYCFGEYYGKEEIESYSCDQCGDWNGTWSDGTFKELFLGDVTSQLEYTLPIVIEELGINDLFDIDEIDNYNLKDESMIESTLDKVMKHPSLYTENVYFTVENEDFSIPLIDVNNKYIKESLIQLMTKVED